MDIELVMKLVGAVAAFGLGIWIGFGTPGVGERPSEKSSWRASDRLGRTWINRLFFRMGGSPRRFDSNRLIVPKNGRSKSGNETGRETVRLRRPGER